MIDCTAVGDEPKIEMNQMISNPPPATRAQEGPARLEREPAADGQAAAPSHGKKTDAPRHLFVFLRSSRLLSCSTKSCAIFLELELCASCDSGSFFALTMALKTVSVS